MGGSLESISKKVVIEVHSIEAGSNFANFDCLGCIYMCIFVAVLFAISPVALPNDTPS